MMINSLNRLFKHLDYQYNYILKKIFYFFKFYLPNKISILLAYVHDMIKIILSYVDNKIEIILPYVHNKIKIILPYFLYGINKIKIHLLYFLYRINKFLKKIFYYKLYLFSLNKYKKLKYTIYKYPRYYNNFKFKEYILYTIIKDYNNIILYYTNIISYNKWKNHLFLLIFTLWFYSILILSNNFTYFIAFKFFFYFLKYLLKYFFILIDYFLYTYLNFTKMPKLLLGIPYIIIIKNIYRLYFILFYIFPSLIFIDFWRNKFYDIQYLFIWIIHRFLDLLEYGIISFAKSRFLYILKRYWFYMKYYASEEDLLAKLILEWISYIKMLYKNSIRYIRYFFLFYIYYSNLLIYIRYLYLILIKRTNLKLKIFEFKTYIKKYKVIKHILLSYYSKKFPIHIKFLFNYLRIILNKNILIILHNKIYEFFIFIMYYFPYSLKYNFSNFLIYTYNFLFFTYHILYFLHL